MKKTKHEARAKRKFRVRHKIQGNSERPRLSVFKSLKHIAAQVINDVTGETLVAASTYEKEFGKTKGNASVAGAKRIGELVAERAKAKGVEAVVFDRGGFRYHGRVKALADAAREKGLKF